MGDFGVLFGKHHAAYPEIDHSLSGVVSPSKLHYTSVNAHFTRFL